MIIGSPATTASSVRTSADTKASSLGSIDGGGSRPPAEDQSTVSARVWLTRAISTGLVDLIDWTEFEDLVYVGEGGFGTISKARWPKRNQTIALKKVDKSYRVGKYADFVKEVRFYHRHPLRKILGH
jgi:hypothetical protein